MHFQYCVLGTTVLTRTHLSLSWLSLSRSLFLSVSLSLSPSLKQASACTHFYKQIISALDSISRSLVKVILQPALSLVRHFSCKTRHWHSLTFFFNKQTENNEKNRSERTASLSTLSAHAHS